MSLRSFPRLVPFLLATLLLAAAGCHRAPAVQPWRLSLRLTPPVPAMIDDIRFDLSVTDAQGRPVTGANASLDLVMATMDMGSSPVPLSPSAPGVYSGTGHFTMGGDWNCNVAVTRGGRTQSQTFHYKVG